MNSEQMTFQSDYLSKAYYVLGDYSFLKSGLFKGKLPRIYFTRDIRKNADCDILVVNLRGRHLFRMPPPNLKYRCTIYTIRPFESIIRYMENIIKYRCVIVDLLDFFLVINLETPSTLLKIDTSSRLSSQEPNTYLHSEEFRPDEVVPVTDGSSLAGAKIYVMLRKFGYVEIFEQYVNDLLKVFTLLPFHFTDEEEIEVAEARLHKTGRTYTRVPFENYGIIATYIYGNGNSYLGRLKNEKRKETTSRSSSPDRGRKMRVISLSQRSVSGCLRDLSTDFASSYLYNAALSGRGTYSQPNEDVTSDFESSEDFFVGKNHGDCTRDNPFEQESNQTADWTETGEEGRRKHSPDAPFLASVFSTFKRPSNGRNSQKFHSRDHRPHGRSSSSQA
ncbi:hypothetical protein PAEPH01_1217 [Pancytospora epiphaga]|nr:hypothetical protein PAEPH01_1217 [Pancytospora epiphaga]